MSSPVAVPSSAHRPVRVERIIARLNIGGPAIHTILLTRHLRDMGFETELVTGVEGPGEGNMLDLAAANNVEPVIYPALGRELSPLKDMAVVWALCRRFRRLRPDVVHTHTAKAGAVGRMAAWLARVPVRVHTFHGHVFSGYFSPAKTRVFVLMERLLARMSTRIIVLGERQKADILSLGIGREQQFVCMPLGLDLSRFLKAEEHRGELRAELGISPETPVVGIVARLVPIKAHEDFLEAAKIVRTSIPEAVFLVVGDGPERARLESLASGMGLDGCVRFLGFRSGLPQVYAGLDVSVLCSHNEGMPVALIESLASGTPAVATDVGETRGIIQDGVSGFIVPVAVPQALAEGIVRVLRSPDAREMGLKGREHVYPRFSIERLTQDMAALYGSLLEETGGLKRK